MLPGTLTRKKKILKRVTEKNVLNLLYFSFKKFNVHLKNTNRSLHIVIRYLNGHVELGLANTF